MGDAVLEVHHKIALHQVGEIEELVDLRAVDEGACRGSGATGAFAAKDFRLRHHHDAPGFRADSRPVQLRVGTKGEAKSLVEGAGFEMRFEGFETRFGRDNFLRALRFARFCVDEDDPIAVLLAGGDALQEFESGFRLGVQPFLGDEPIAGITTVVDEAFAVPGAFFDRASLEPKRGFIDVLQRDGARGARQDRSEKGRPVHLCVGGDFTQLGFELRWLNEHDLGRGRQVVRDAGAAHFQFAPGRRGEHDGFHAGP